MLHLGKQKLAKQAEDIHNALIKVVDYVRKDLQEITVVGDPQVLSTFS